MVDSSALPAVLYREPDAERYETANAKAPNRRMSVANVLEVSAIVEARGGVRRQGKSWTRSWTELGLYWRRSRRSRLRPRASRGAASARAITRQR